jgi:hypothetical protein
MCLRVGYKKKIRFFLYASLMSLKKGVGSGSASKCHGSSTLLHYYNYCESLYCFEAVFQFQHLIKIWLFLSLKAVCKM